MSIDTAVHTDKLMDLIEALRGLGATITLPPDLLAGATTNRAVPLGFRTNSAQLPSGQVLTHTEFQVLRYLPTHLTLSDIAREISRSTDTIKTHVRHLYIKLDAHNRNEAVRNARASGLLA